MKRIVTTLLLSAVVLRVIIAYRHSGDLASGFEVVPPLQFTVL